VSERPLDAGAVVRRRRRRRRRRIQDSRFMLSLLP